MCCSGSFKSICIMSIYVSPISYPMAFSWILWIHTESSMTCHFQMLYIYQIKSVYTENGFWWLHLPMAISTHTQGPQSHASGRCHGEASQECLAGAVEIRQNNKRTWGWQDYELAGQDFEDPFKFILTFQLALHLQCICWHSCNAADKPNQDPYCDSTCSKSRSFIELLINAVAWMPITSAHVNTTFEFKLNLKGLNLAGCASDLWVGQSCRKGSHGIPLS